MKFLSPRAVLLIIFAIFLLPLLLAWFMHTGLIKFAPETTRNQGILVDSPVPVSWSLLDIENGEGHESPTDVLAGHWTILYPLPPSCDQPCITHVTSLRQVHRAAGRNQDRVRVALLAQGHISGTTRQKLLTVYRHFTLVSDPAGSFEAILASAADAAGIRSDRATYLIDPPGNIMMLYSTGADPNDLNKDLKRLLTWSKMDKQK